MEQAKQKYLFIDRDGTLIEEPEDEQVDTLEKFIFKKGVLRYLPDIARKTDYRLVMVSNQDGLGTEANPLPVFERLQAFLLKSLRQEGVEFHEILVDEHYPEDNHPNRKPQTGMLRHYLSDPEADIAHSYVIGDRETDRQLAENMGCHALILDENGETWGTVAQKLILQERTAEYHRKTNETDILVKINLDGTGQSHISTGLGFFDHMLEQIAKHGMVDLFIEAKGDLQVDEHHTIEDTALTLGTCLREALGEKLGIMRYGFQLPMDDCLCSVALDFGGRPWLVWDAEFKRERVGDVPTEMFLHFFKSLSDSALINLNVKAEGQNEHHKAEGIFKAFARALRMAKRVDMEHLLLPSTKGAL